MSSIVLVTGATDGIGKQTASDLAKKGHHVLVHGRKTPEYAADFASLDDVRRLAAEVIEKHPKLDVLVNNAGVFKNERVMTKDGFETTFQVNHLAPFLLTHLLLPILRVALQGRIVNVSSMAHSGGDMDWNNLQGEKHYDGYDAYARSKLANVLFTIELAKRIGAAPSPTVNALHPGVVSTKLLKEGFGSRGPDSLAEGAATSVYLATSPDVAGKTGGYYVRSRPSTPSAAARDANAQKKLFDLSLKMVGLAMLLFVMACKTPPVEDKSQAAEPRQTTQALVDKWAKVDPKTLPSGPADLMKGRPVLVITIDPLPRAYEPGMPGTCFASRADDVGLVVIAKARREPTHLTRTSVGLHDKTWMFDAIAVPDGKLVASWTRFSAAEEPQTVTGSRTNNGTRLTQMDAFAPFPRAAFDADCSALQAGIMPAQD